MFITKNIEKSRIKDAWLPLFNTEIRNNCLSRGRPGFNSRMMQELKNGCIRCSNVKIFKFLMITFRYDTILNKHVPFVVEKAESTHIVWFTNTHGTKIIHQLRDWYRFVSNVYFFNCQVRLSFLSREWRHRIFLYYHLDFEKACWICNSLNFVWFLNSF